MNELWAVWDAFLSCTEIIRDRERAITMISILTHNITFKTEIQNPTWPYFPILTHIILQFALSLSLFVSLSLRNLSSLFPPLPQSLEKKMKTSSFVFLLVVIILSFSLLASSSGNQINPPCYSLSCFSLYTLMITYWKHTQKWKWGWRITIFQWIQLRRQKLR